MRNARIIGRTLAAIIGMAVVGSAYADDDKTLTQKLIEADGRLALQKMEQDLNKGTPPATVSSAPAAAPAPTEARAAKERSKARTIALYGVDGRAAGGTLSLRSYVQWGGEICAARIGGQCRGYSVGAITERGTTLAKGKTTVFAPYEQDDTVNLVEQGPQGEAPTATRPAGPLPLQGSTPAGFTAPVPPQPSLSPMPAAPVMPPVAPAPFQAGASNVAQR